MMKTILLLLLSSILLNPLSEVVYHDYTEGLKIAENENKPVFLLFTSKSCENNDRFRNLLERPKVKEQLEKFVQIHLYVDDPEELEEPYKVIRDTFEIGIRTLGHKWVDLEISKYNSNQQPLLFIIDSDENIVTGPKSYEEVKWVLHMYLIESALVYEQKKY